MRNRGLLGGGGAPLDLVQVRLCGLGPIETMLAEIQDSLRVLPTIEGRLGEGRLAGSQSGGPYCLSSPPHSAPIE